MQTFKVTAIQHFGKPTERRAEYTIYAPTKGDAILRAQQEFAKGFGLNRSEEALVRIEFE